MTITAQVQQELQELLGSNWEKIAQSAIADLQSGHYTSIEQFFGGLGLYEKWRNLRQTRQEKKRPPPEPWAKARKKEYQWTGEAKREEKPREKPPETPAEVALRTLGL